MCYLIKKYWNPNSVFVHIGKYGNPPELKIWMKQISLYLFALLVNKIFFSPQTTPNKLAYLLIAEAVSYTHLRAHET